MLPGFYKSWKQNGMTANFLGKLARKGNLCWLFRKTGRKRKLLPSLYENW